MAQLFLRFLVLVLFASLNLSFLLTQRGAGIVTWVVSDSSTAAGVLAAAA